MGGQPTLVEDHSALTVLDSLRFQPRAIAVIGGRSKREIFGDKSVGSITRIQGIQISRWSKSQLLINCKLHECTALSNLNVLPPSGSRRQHSLGSLISLPNLSQALLSLSFNFY